MHASTRSVRDSRQPRAAIVLAIACAVASVAALGSSTHAQNGAPSPMLNGTWRLATQVAEAQSSVERAIGPALSRLAPDRQQLARARLAESTWVPQQLVINASAQQISVQVVGQENRTFTSSPGQAQNIYSRSGVRASLTQVFRPDGGLEQQLRAMDGTLYNFYFPVDSRSLNLDVLIESDQLSGQVRCR
ncbi:MAG: hypothetical protein AB7P00_33095, partial [Sandaracinaceae bacterium]